MKIYRIELSDQIKFCEIEVENPAKDSNHFRDIIDINCQGIAASDVVIDKSWHKRRYGFPLSDTEIVTFLTHRSSWKVFLNNDPSQYCLVLEENIFLDFDLEELIGVLDELPQDWDVFFPYDQRKILEEKVKLSNLSTRNINIWEKHEREPYLLGFNWGSSIYFLSKKGAKKLVEGKIIKQCVEDEMLLQSRNNVLNLYYSEVNCFEIDKYPKKKNIDRESIIRQTILSYNLWPSKAEEILVSIMSKLSEISKQLNVKLLLHGGSLLGCIRHGGKMPWDDDIDLGIEENCANIFINEVKKSGLIVSLWTEQRTNTSYYKIWSSMGEEIVGYKHLFPFVDIWIYNIVGKNVVFKNGILFPNAAKSFLENIEFEGGQFAIPYNAMECLDSMYKDWKNTIRIYQWNHQHEKPVNRRLKTSIVVDPDGRIENIE